MAKPHQREFFAPTPSRVTLFFRTFFPWQIVRFVWINLKMIRMIGLAHSGRAAPPPSAPATTPEAGAPAHAHGR